MITADLFLAEKSRSAKKRNLHLQVPLITRKKRLSAVRYTAITSISGSIVFSNCSMLTSVPDIELGQLPQAPW